LIVTFVVFLLFFLGGAGYKFIGAVRRIAYKVCLFSHFMCFWTFLHLFGVVVVCVSNVQFQFCYVWFTNYKANFKSVLAVQIGRLVCNLYY